MFMLSRQTFSTEIRANLPGWYFDFKGDVSVFLWMGSNYFEFSFPLVKCHTYDILSYRSSRLPSFRFSFLLSTNSRDRRMSTWSTALQAHRRGGSSISTNSRDRRNSVALIMLEMLPSDTWFLLSACQMGSFVCLFLQRGINIFWIPKNSKNIAKGIQVAAKKKFLIVNLKFLQQHRGFLLPFCRSTQVYLRLNDVPVFRGLDDWSLTTVVSSA